MDRHTNINKYKITKSLISNLKLFKQLLPIMNIKKIKLKTQLKRFFAYNIIYNFPSNPYFKNARNKDIWTFW